jgi:hypothetical protein
LQCHRQTPNKSATFVTNGAAAGGDQTTVVTAIDIPAMTMRGLAIIDNRMATMAGMATRMVIVAGITVGATTTTDDINELLALSMMRQLKFIRKTNNFRFIIPRLQVDSKLRKARTFVP